VEITRYGPMKDAADLKVIEITQKTNDHIAISDAKME
jgi:hypothetical protein